MKYKNKILAPLLMPFVSLFLTGALFTNNSYAAPATTNMQASANLTGSCKLDVPSVIAFGSVMGEVVNNSSVRREVPFTAMCSKGVQYTITKNTKSGFDALRSVSNPEHTITIYIDGRKANSNYMRDMSYDRTDGPFVGENALIGTGEPELLYISAALIFYNFPKADEYATDFSISINF